MVDRWGDNWAEHLPLAKFTFNSSICSSTGLSPFEVAYGHQLSFPDDLSGEPCDVPRAEAAATRIIALTTACRDHFEISQMANQDRVPRRQDGPVHVGDPSRWFATQAPSRWFACPGVQTRNVGNMWGAGEVLTSNRQNQLLAVRNFTPRCLLVNVCADGEVLRTGTCVCAAHARSKSLGRGYPFDTNNITPSKIQP